MQFMRAIWQRLIDLPHHLSKKEKIALALLAVLFVVYGGVKTRDFIYNRLVIVPTYGGRIVEGIVGQPQLLSPLTTSNPTDQTILALLYPGLTRTTADGRTEPVLADSWQISEDGKSYTFTLHEGLRWHDGTSLTTSDVAESVRRVLDEETRSPYYNNWDGVTVEVVDEKTIAFHLEEPSAPFLAATSLPIIPLHIPLATLQQSFIGSGPYRYTKSTSEGNTISTIELTSNADWYAGKPFIDEFVFRFFDNEAAAQTAFKKGDIDSFVDTVQAEMDQNLYSLPTQQLRVLFLNTGRDSFKDVTVRQALLTNNPSTTTPPTLAVLVHTNRQSSAPFLELMQQWTARGIVVDIVALDSAPLLERINSRDYDALYVDIDMSADLDRYPLWHSSQRENGLNFSQLDNAEIDKKLEAARAVIDLKERERLTNEIEQQVETLAVAKTLEQVTINWHVNARVRGIPDFEYVVASPDRFAHIEQWHVKTMRRSLKGLVGTE